MVGEKGTVCVTGGAGYTASWLIMRLLKDGYSVRATVRSDPKFKEDPSHILNLPEAPEKLQIFDAELEKPESFDAVIDGCVGVFHISHPMNFDEKMSAEAITKTAVEGALGILQACIKSKTVKKLVYTSTVAAASVTLTKDVEHIDETMWSDVESLRSGRAYGQAYMISKTLTERAVLEFSKQHGLDVVTILPAVILGPFLTAAFPASFPLTLPLILGNENYCKYMKNAYWVHVDDVASAQIFLFECPKAQGRYICSRADVTIHEIHKLLTIKYSEHLIPTDFLGEMEEEKPIHLSSNKLMELGFNFKYGVEDMIDGALECCKDKGFL